MTCTMPGIQEVPRRCGVMMVAIMMETVVVKMLRRYDGCEDQQGIMTKDNASDVKKVTMVVAD